MPDEDVSTIVDHERRISVIEASMGDIRVEVATLGVKLDGVTSGQTEMKHLLQARLERDEERHATLEQQRTEVEGRVAMIRALFDPRTLIILSTVLASNCGSDAIVAVADIASPISEMAPALTDDQ
tara:strand:+ start:71 stop:448 length:378 start_codon:yes stop_codon:yes gene_type:complete